jgi:hypothetical protein
MATTPSHALFDSLTSWAAIRRLVDAGETEGLYLECKAPAEPRLTKDLRTKLAEAVSGFGNTGGGVILWGVSTTRHAHSGLDVLTQLEPIGSAHQFAQQVDAQIPVSGYPALGAPPSRVLHEHAGDTRGIVVSHIPPTPGDPVESTADRHFHFRNGDEFTVMPYDMLRRMFAGVSSPDLYPLFDPRLITTDEEGRWNLTFILLNRSSAAATDGRVFVWFENPDHVHSITSVSSFVDASSTNPGATVFTAALGAPVYRGLHQLIGTLAVAMGRGSRPYRVLQLNIQIFASGMRAREWHFKVHMAQTGFSVRSVVDRFLY